MSEYHIAQINIARMRGANINDPIMQEFVDNLDKVNTIAEASPGFIWRLKDDNNNATAINPYNDEQVIINVSVWHTIDALEHFMYKTMHAGFLKRRKEWFDRFGKVYTAMWWIKPGEYPTIPGAVEKLDHLQRNGASVIAFDFKTRYPAPIV